MLPDVGELHILPSKYHQNVTSPPRISQPEIPNGYFYTSNSPEVLHPIQKTFSNGPRTYCFSLYI